MMEETSPMMQLLESRLVNLETAIDKDMLYATAIQRGSLRHAMKSYKELVEKGIISADEVQKFKTTIETKCEELIDRADKILTERRTVNFEGVHLSTEEYEKKWFASSEFVQFETTLPYGKPVFKYSN